VPFGQVVDVSIPEGRMRIDPETPTLFKVDKKMIFFLLTLFFCSLLKRSAKRNH
jgi:hypothetical protein